MRREAAFSLIELLVTVLVTAVLATFGLVLTGLVSRQVTKLAALPTLKSSY